MMRAGQLAPACLIAALVAAPPDLGAQQAWRPERNVEIVVPTAPGGGNDKWR